MKFLFASLKTFTNSKNCSVSRIKFLFRLSFAPPCSFFSCVGTFIADFRNNFLGSQAGYRTILETQAAIRKSGQAPLREFLEGIS